MKKTLDLEDDVAEKLDRVAQATGVSLDKVLNEAVREGLPAVARKAPLPSKPFHQKAYDLGLRPNIDFDQTLSLAGQLEDEHVARKMGRRQ